MPRSLPEGYVEATEAAYKDALLTRGIEYGHCFCGCGQKTRLANQSNTALGWIKGRPGLAPKFNSAPKLQSLHQNCKGTYPLDGSTPGAGVSDASE